MKTKSTRISLLAGLFIALNAAPALAADANVDAVTTVAMVKAIPPPMSENLVSSGSEVSDSAIKRAEFWQKVKDIFQGNNRSSKLYCADSALASNLD